MSKSCEWRTKKAGDFAEAPAFHRGVNPSVISWLTPKLPILEKIAMRFKVYRDGVQWRWRLLATNNRNIANSGEAYHNKSDCLAAIELVKRSSSAPIDEED